MLGLARQLEDRSIVAVGHTLDAEVLQEGHKRQPAVGHGALGQFGLSHPVCEAKHVAPFDLVKVTLRERAPKILENETVGFYRLLPPVAQPEILVELLHRVVERRMPVNS